MEASSGTWQTKFKCTNAFLCFSFSSSVRSHCCHVTLELTAVRIYGHGLALAGVAEAQNSVMKSDGQSHVK
jgi:hypothetical protein